MYAGQLAEAELKHLAGGSLSASQQQLKVLLQAKPPQEIMAGMAALCPPWTISAMSHAPQQSLECPDVSRHQRARQFIRDTAGGELP